jgi:glutaredoxin
MYDKALMYSKEYCPYCSQAELLLRKRNIPYEKLVIGIGSGNITKADLLEKVPNAKTVPQIFLYKDDKEIYIGGFTDLKDFFENATN